MAPLQRQPKACAAAPQMAQSHQPQPADHPLWHSPRQVAQRAAIAASFGSSSAVVQRVPAGRYVTTEDGNLRDVNKAVLAHVKQGTEARVQYGAATETFKLPGLSWPKPHTWTQVLGQEGWLKDSVLGQAQPEIAPAHNRPGRDRSDDDLAIEPVRATRPTFQRPTPSAAMGMGVRSASSQQAEPPATTSIGELDAHRQAADEQLEYPGVARGAEPLGLGKPTAVNPADYHVQVNGGNLYERTGQTLLTVAKSPFVLSTGGQLYGGQGATHPMQVTMQRHGDAHEGFPAWAGEMGVANGQVTYIDNESGTFKLKDEANINLIKFLYRRQVLNAQQVPGLNVNRVSSWSLDRGGVIDPHRVLGQ